MDNAWIWLGVSGFFVFALSLDSFLLSPNKFARPYQSMRASLSWTFVWVLAALIFNAFIWFYYHYQGEELLAKQKALEFFVGYVIEKSLSVDNLFVFYMIFNHFRIPVPLQQRVLTYGIWGAIIMRLILILLGVWLIARFHWLLYIMGAFLIFTGLKICLAKEKAHDLSETWLLTLASKLVRITPQLEGQAFFLKQNGLMYATPMFLALIFVEFSDLIFAFDSIPAIFAITRDPFIVWTSNVFAILGLRALYFLLANMANTFRLLKYGIALLLMFVGFKMVSEPWLHLSIYFSLTVIVTVLFSFILLSVLLYRDEHAS